MSTYFQGLDSSDILTQFESAVEADAENIWALRSALVIQSDRAVEELNWLGQVPALTEWVGNRSIRPVYLYTHSVTNKTFESTVRFSVEDLMNDKTGMIQQKISALAGAANRHWNKLAADLFNAGTAGTVGLAYDGQFFFDTDHNESGSNQSNDLTATEIPSANVGTATAPTAVEAANIITEMVGYAKTLTDDQGEPTNQNITAVQILCPRHTIYSAFLQATNLPNLTSGQTNPAYGLMNFDVQYSPRFTAANNVIFNFIEGGNMNAKPIIFTEKSLDVQLQGAGSAMEFNEDAYAFGVKAVRGSAYGAWQKSLYVALS